MSRSLSDYRQFVVKHVTSQHLKSRQKTEEKLWQKKNSFVVSSLLCFVLILFQMCFLFQQKGERDVIFFLSDTQQKTQKLFQLQTLDHIK